MILRRDGGLNSNTYYYVFFNKCHVIQKGHVICVVSSMNEIRALSYVRNNLNVI